LGVEYTGFDAEAIAQWNATVVLQGKWSSECEEYAVFIIAMKDWMNRRYV
jgi:hypothetical protein